MLIKLNGKKVDFDNLHKFNAQTEFEENTIKFIQKWNSGKLFFEMTTSGSTGKPKPISISRVRMELSAKATIKALQIPIGGTSLVCLNTAFIAGKMMLVRALVNKMNIIAVEPTSNPLSNIEVSQSLDFTAMVPLQMEAMLDANNFNNTLHGLKTIILGGAPVSKSLEDKLSTLDAAIYATYGMTETVSHIALRRLNGATKASVFSTLPNVKIGIDERDCLTVQSPVTENKTITTNDRIKLIDERSFQWLGRLDNVINTGGVKVQSELLELAIAGVLSHMNVKSRFFCYGLKNEKLGQEVVLVTEGEMSNQKELLDQLKSELPRFHAPKRIICIPNFIETKTGKINRKLTIEYFFTSLPST